MRVYLIGSNSLHLNLIQSTLLASGWSSDDVQTLGTRSELEAALTLPLQAMLVVDLEPGQETPTLGWLADITRRWPWLQVVVLSGQRDEALLMQAMRSGAREVLDSPPEPSELVQTLQRLAPQVSSPMNNQAPLAPLLAFISSKGGNGSTLLAGNLAWLLALEFGRDTVLADLDLAYGDASFYLGGGQARHSLDQLALQGQRMDARLLHSSAHWVHERLHLLAAPASPLLSGALTGESMVNVLTLARQQHQVLIVDVPHQPDALGLQVLRTADAVCVVMRRRVPDVRNAQRLIQLLRDQGVAMQRIRPVLNRADDDSALDVATMDKALPIPIAHRVAEDRAALQACVHLGLPLHEQAPGSPVLRDLRQMGSQCLGLPLPNRRSWLGRWLGKTAASSAA